MKKFLLLVILFLVTILISIFLRSRQITNIQNDCESRLKNDVVEETYAGIPHPVDFSIFPDAKTYYTRIIEAVEKGVNFSGRYVLIPVGCGTDCVLFAVVDAKTGKVIVYDSGRANYHLINKDSYFVLEPVFAGQAREFYKIKNNCLELICSEKSKTDMYGTHQ